MQAQRAMASLSVLRNAMTLQKAVSLYQTAVSAYAQVGFRAAEFLVKAGPTIRRVTTIAGVVFVASTVELACEEFGFVPRTGYTEFVVAASASVFSGGMALSEVSNHLRGMIDPLRGSRDGQLLSGTQANREVISKNSNYVNTPPYPKYSFAARGRIAPNTKLVRVYNPNDPINPSQQQRAWVMPRSEVTGLSPEQIAQKFRLPNVPTDITDVQADGIEALVGQTANNFGYYGGVGGTQIYLLDRGATFTNARLLLPGGIL